MRDGSGNYHTIIPDAISGTTISSADYNANLHDVANDLNFPRPILCGGTGANNAPQALINLGAVPLAGGTMTGVLTAPQYVALGGAKATPGVISQYDLASSDATSPLVGVISLIGDATAANRKLSISCLEQGISWRDIEIGTGNSGVNFAGSGPVKVLGTTASASPATGALTVAGGLGVGSDIRANGLIYAQAADASARQFIAVNSTGNVQLLQANGYASLMEASNQHFVLGTNNSTHIRMTGTQVSVETTAASSSPTTGALTVAGGLGVVGGIISGNTISTSASVAGNFGFQVTNSSAASNASACLVLRNNSAHQSYVFMSSSTYSVGGGGESLVLWNDVGAIAFAVSGSSRGNVQADGKLVWGADGAYKPGGGPWADSSDARIKHVGTPYEHGLAEVLQLQPKYFTFLGNDTVKPPPPDQDAPFHNSPHHDAAASGIEYVGLIAQEVEDILPEMVSKRAGYIDGEAVDDLRDLDTTALIYTLVNSVKELAARIAALEAKK